MQALFICSKLLARVVPVSIMLCFQTHGQVRWDGEGGDGLWNTAVNWTGDIIPTAGDDVLLDHSIVAANYVVTLPSGMNAVTIKRLIIFPSTAQTIEVRLPATNTAVPGFTCSGLVYGLEIR